MDVIEQIFSSIARTIGCFLPTSVDSTKQKWLNKFENINNPRQLRRHASMMDSLQENWRESERKRKR